MSRCQIIAELATGHGGDLDLAERMIHAAAEAGADWVKTQAYTLETLNRADPLYDWLVKSHLGEEAHERLKASCVGAGVRYLSTPMDPEANRLLLGLEVPRKIASTHSVEKWWLQPAFVSYPWGRHQPYQPAWMSLTAIPLYPTPLDAVGAATLLDGWSDHCEGISACLRAIALGAKVIEVHLTIPGARQMPWDKTPAQIRELRAFAEDCATMTTGVSSRYRQLWTAQTA